MTPASPDAAKRHDTLVRMPSKGTDRRSFRLDTATWEKFDRVAKDAGTDRTTLIRDFIRWMNGEPGVSLAAVEGRVRTQLAEALLANAEQMRANYGKPGYEDLSIAYVNGYEDCAADADPS